MKGRNIKKDGDVAPREPALEGAVDGNRRAESTIINLIMF